MKSLNLSSFNLTILALAGRFRRPLNLLVFDLDGTLVDSRYDLADAVNYALERLGRPPLGYDAIPPLLGSGLTHLLQNALQNEDPALLQSARAYFDSYYRNNYTRKTICYPEVPETLSYFAGKKKAVLSNKAHPFTCGIIAGLGLTDQFDLVLGARPERFPLKPDPAALHYLLSELKVAPEHALMIGDSTHDIEAGRAAGMATCAVTYGYRPAEVLAAAEPDLMIDHLSELRERIPG